MWMTRTVLGLLLAGGLLLGGTGCYPDHQRHHGPRYVPGPPPPASRPHMPRHVPPPPVYHHVPRHVPPPPPGPLRHHPPIHHPPLRRR